MKGDSPELLTLVQHRVSMEQNAERGGRREEEKIEEEERQHTVKPSEDKHEGES